MCLCDAALGLRLPFECVDALWTHLEDALHLSLSMRLHYTVFAICFLLFLFHLVLSELLFEVRFSSHQLPPKLLQVCLAVLRQISVSVCAFSFILGVCCPLKSVFFYNEKKGL